MQSETGHNIGDSNGTVTLEVNVRSAVEQGHDVQEMVRQYTLRTISARSVDIESLRQIASAVLRGAQAGAQKEIQKSAEQTEITRAGIKLAVAGLDAALAQFAEASKLSLKEAANRVQTFSSEDLTHTCTDLESMKAKFLETLQSSASGAKGVAGEILYDLASHARIHSSTANAQLKEALALVFYQLGEAGRNQVGAGLHLTQKTSDLLRKIAAGVLTGLADPSKPGQSQGKEE
ncbi:MAG: hypothetical protein PHP95_12615 [Desulfuromonadaceae bacterium]|jgi:antitoxin (DNA-binding transcriptional repressor) of toxin-antitoxin stability system|nr:hypothetical protein [Desulfuromonadaceae bacterium]MDD4131914.1 hypothetical protein [Desulfuromonadaceae bacterium]